MRMRAGSMPSCAVATSTVTVTTVTATSTTTAARPTTGTGADWSKVWIGPVKGAHDLSGALPWGFQIRADFEAQDRAKMGQVQIKTCGADAGMLEMHLQVCFCFCFLFFIRALILSACSDAGHARIVLTCQLISTAYSTFCRKGAACWFIAAN